MKYQEKTYANQILAQWEKLTGRSAQTENEREECFSCYHESRAALTLATLKRESKIKVRM